MEQICQIFKIWHISDLACLPSQGSSTSFQPHKEAIEGKSKRQWRHRPKAKFCCCLLLPPAFLKQLSTNNRQRPRLSSVICHLLSGQRPTVNCQRLSFVIRHLSPINGHIPILMTV